VNTATTSMNFDQLVTALGADDAAMNMYALVDAAQFYDVGLGAISGLHKHKLISLLGEQAEPDAIYAGPLLIPLFNQHSEMLVDGLLSFLDRFNAVSFLSSSGSISGLTAHLTWLTDVKHDDGTEWVMRYFDPRILPFWLGVLTPQQKELALGPVHRWIYWSPEGMLATVAGHNGPLSSMQAMIHFDREQHERLMHDALPYTIASMLEDDDPSGFTGINYFDKIQQLSRILAQGESLGIEVLIDQKLFCFIALRSIPGFIHDEAVRPAIEAAPFGKFSELVAGWSEDTWQRILK
jgi:hypothetical protein